MTQVRPGLDIQESTIRHCYWTTHDTHEDLRGGFSEIINESVTLALIGEQVRQVNVSTSKAAVLRGMHYHKTQMDAWYVVSGIAQVVLHNMKYNLFEQQYLFPGQGVLISPGIGHGYLATTDLTLVYGVSQEYDHSSPDDLEYNAFGGDVGWKWDLDGHAVIRSDRDTAALTYRHGY